MSRKNKIQMPQSTAGLIRYFDQSKEAIKLKPEFIVGACIVLMAVILALRYIII